MSNLKKLNQPLKPVFDPDQLAWDEKEEKTISEIQSEYETELLKREKINSEILPHQRKLEEIIFDVRTLFFKILEMLLNKENPIPMILADNRRQLAFCLIVIFIGTLMLLISNLLKD